MAGPVRPKHRVRPAFHGGLRRREIEAMGLDPTMVIDFSANLNPYGPPPAVRKAVRGALASIASYPDPDASELEEAIARKLGCDPSEVLVGAGSTQLIHLSALAYVQEGSKVLIPAHTYGEYEVATLAAGGRVRWVSMPGLVLSAERVASEVQDAALLFICNPNNPTGQLLQPGEIGQLGETCADAACIMVLDEAFRDFLPGSHETLPLALEVGSVILLRSFTKIYGMPGLRVGYALGPSELLEPLRRLRPPWSVGALAQAAAMAALEEDEFVASTRELLWRNRRVFQESLRVLPSSANFFMLEVGSATKVRRDLLQEGFLVRDCSSFGLPEYIRFAVRKRPENRGLVEALARVVPGVHRR